MRYPGIAPKDEKGGGWSRVPASVWTDPRLKHADIRVYCAIAARAFEGNTTSVGTRLIAVESTVGHVMVRKCIARLVKCDHLRLAPRKRGQRPIYVLTSEYFGQKQGKADVVVSAPNGRKRLVSVEKTA